MTIINQLNSMLFAGLRIVTWKRPKILAITEGSCVKRFWWMKKKYSGASLKKAFTSTGERDFRTKRSSSVLRNSDFVLPPLESHLRHRDKDSTNRSATPVFLRRASNDSAKKILHCARTPRF